jgi:hypothetical protein
MSTGTELRPLQPLPDLDAHLARWVTDGVVTPEQAEGIRAEERALLLPPAKRSALVTEALGYLGGLLVVVAGLLLVSRAWPHLGLTARLGLVGAGAVLLLLVGALLPATTDSPTARLRSVLWVLATGTTAFFVGLLGHEVLDLRGADVGLLVTSASAVLAGVLWFLLRVLPQQAAFFVALTGSAAAALLELPTTGSTRPTLAGVGILVVGALWIGLAQLGRLEPRSAALALGAAGSVVAAVMIANSGWGHFVGLAAVAGLAVAGLLLGEMVVLGAGAVGILLVRPPVMNDWFPGAVAAPLALLVSGALLVLVALRALRARG